MENQPITPNNQEPIHKRFMNHKLASVGIAVVVLAVATGIAFWQKPSVDTEYVSQVDKSYVYRNGDFNFELVLNSAWEGYKVEQNQDNQITFLVPLVSESGVSGRAYPWYAPFYLWFHTPQEWEDIIKAGVQGQKELLANNSEYFVSATRNNPPQELAGVDFGVASVLSSFKFIEPTETTSSWKTYSNTSLGFSIQHPSNIPPTLELDDEYNRLTSFGSLFEVRLGKDTDSNMGVLYGFLGSEVVSQNIKLGGVTGFSAVSKTGYGDAGSQGLPYIEFAARHNGDVYHLIFYGDTKVSAEESQILSTFKFTK